MKNINKRDAAIAAGAFLVGTVMGGFLIKLAIVLGIFAALGYAGYVGYTLYKKGAFSK